jgi:hypothetical protein
MRYKLTDYEWAKRPFLANKPRGVLCVNDLLAHDLFRSSFARRSGLREGGKPISTLGSSPRAGFSGSCAVLLKTMRLKSGIWVAAYVRRCHIEAAFAAVRRRGTDEAGAVFIKINRLDGTATLYGPAPQAVFNEAQPAGRLFTVILGREAPVAEADIEARLVREIRFDPDIWIVEIEDRAGRHFLDDAVV